MRNTAIKDQAEFEARQRCFEFGDACRFVNDLIVSVKKAVSAYASATLKAFRMPRPEVKKPEQFRLDLLAWMSVGITA